MGGSCSTYGLEERCIQGLWWGNVRERDHLEDSGANGRIVLKWVFRKWDVEALAGSSCLRLLTGGGNL